MTSSQIINDINNQASPNPGLQTRDNSKTPIASNNMGKGGFSQALDYSRVNFHPKDSPRLKGMRSESELDKSQDEVSYILEQSSEEESKCSAYDEAYR